MKRFGVLVVMTVCLATQAIAQAPRHVALHVGHLLDVKSGKMLADQMLVMEKGKIVSTGAAAEAKIPSRCSANRVARRDRAAWID